MTTRTKNGKRGSVPLGFGGVTAFVGDHIAHFYRGSSQMLSVLGPYIAEGIRQGDKCIVISSPDVAKQLQEWLTSRGLDAHAACKSRQLFFYPGQPTSVAMQAFAEKVVDDASTNKYKIIRWAGDGGWALAGQITVREMLRWEALYDKISVNWPSIALCQFDLTQFGGDAVMDALRSHPLCIMGQLLVPNPFHVSPEALLQELNERE